MKFAIRLLRGHISNMEADIIVMKSEKSKAILETNKVTIELTVNHYNKQIEQHKEAIAELER
jgi:hypothetical protein